MSLSQDIAKIDETSPEAFNKVIEFLSNPENSRLDWAVFAESIAKEGESENLKALLRVLNFVGSNLASARNYDEELKELDKFAQRVLVDSGHVVSGWKRILSSLDQLQKYFLIKKEQEIKDRFSRIVEFAITVDSRPIFDMRRVEIEKVIYPCILKIETSDEDEFICEFYEDMLDSLIEELQLAKRKMELIRISNNNGR